MNTNFSPAVQLSHSVNQDTVTSGGLQVQYKSDTSVHLESQHQSQEPETQPFRENTPAHPQTTVDDEQQRSLLEGQATEEKPKVQPQLNKSQSLMGAFGLKDTSFFRTASEDTANAETIRNLRKSFASLFSE
ncbi:synapsin-2-like [Lates calcarifer]|nr:synapsin-2-like [Lates calcarifer]